MTIVVNQHLLTNEYPVRILMYPKPEQCVHCTELKECFDWEGQDFLDRIITCDKTWVHHFTPESK